MNANTAVLHQPSTPPHVAVSTRPAGLAIAIATIVSTVAVAMDQGGGGNGITEILRSIAGLQSQKAIVHGIAIASVLGYAYGFTVLAARLGLSRHASLAGLVAYLAGCIAMVGATIMDGFITPHVAADAIAGSPERIRIAYELVHYIGLALTDVAKIAWLLQAIGSVTWAMVLMSRAGAQRVVGVVGLISSALVAAAILASPPSMSMVAILAILLAQMTWNLAAAWLLARKGGIAP